jgi:hypothetical protein
MARWSAPAESLSEERVFDAHCHVLNLEYLMLETIQILWDMMRGTYPLPREAAIDKTLAVHPEFELRYPVEAATGFLSWLIEIGRAAFRSEEADVKEMRRTAQKVWAVEQLQLVPLMMDVYFMFAPPLGPEEPGVTVQRATGAAAESGKLDLYARAFRKLILQSVGRARDHLATGRDGKSGYIGRIDALIGSLVENVVREETSALAADAPSFKATAGFIRQFRAVSALGSKGSGIYPFFAVDARREGAIEWVIRSGQVGADGPFYGVKLYPRLGCHPERRELEPLFAHCEKNRIPITTHTSHRGFPHWMNAYADFGNPRNFRAIFERHPEIRIDLAHFGDRPDETSTDDWGLTIAGLMRDFRGAYSDLSCFTQYAALERYVERYQDLPNVRDRTMFGSDCNVLSFTEPGITLERYYSRFLKQFGAERLGDMASRVPRAFLGL